MIDKRQNNNTSRRNNMPNSIRIGVTRNKGAKKPQASSIFILKLPTTYKTLVKTCTSKLNIKSKTPRLFVCRGGGATTAAGFEITPNVDLEKLNHEILCNGVLICVSEKGADYNNGSGVVAAHSDALSKSELNKITSQLSMPPRWFPGFDLLKKNDTSPNIMVGGSDYHGDGDGDYHGDGDGDGDGDSDSASDSHCNDAKNDKVATNVGIESFESNKMVGEMKGNAAVKGSNPISYNLNGAFPIIPKDADMRETMRDTISFGNSGSGSSNSRSNNNNSKTKSLAQGCSPGGIFQEIHRGNGFIVYDYRGEANIPPEFPNPLSTAKKLSEKERYQRALLRECRGLILCARSGR